MTGKRKADHLRSSNGRSTSGTSDQVLSEESVSENRSQRVRDGVHMPSFTLANRSDIWSPSNEEDSHTGKKTGKPRISHFIYFVQFNPDPPEALLKPGDFKHIVAIVTAEHLILLKVSADGTNTQLGDVIVVPDQQGQSKDKEDLYTAQWVKEPTTRTTWSAVAFAGSTGIIRIVDFLAKPERTAFLRGHAAAVNELNYCPQYPAFLLSASKDQTIRLWSIKYLTCLASFSGAQGHRAEIITLDVHRSGQFMASGSFDSCIKVWSFFGSDNKPLLDTIRIHGITSDPKPCIISAPLFSVNDVHDRQIDCVRWLLCESKNYFLVSKASDETILIWMPVLPHGAKTPGIGTEWHLCHKIKLKDNKFWFVKFALIHQPFCVLAIGDDTGKIKLHDLYSLVAKQKSAVVVLKTITQGASSPNKGLIRSVAFSGDGALLVGGSDDGMCYFFRRSDVELNGNSSNGIHDNGV